MSREGNSNVRIDWFDGTVVESPNVPTLRSFEEEEKDEEGLIPPESTYKKNIRDKCMGFMKLSELSIQESSTIVLRLRNPHIFKMFYNLLESEMQTNFIVLVVKVLAKISADSFRTKHKILEEVIKSKFLDTLKEYIHNLPSTRIVDKRNNSVFWEDVEGFYSDVMNFISHSLQDFPEKNEIFNDIFDVTIQSVTGVVDEHMEQFSDEFFTLMDKVKKILQTKCFESQIEKGEFRSLNIFPTTNDLSTNSLMQIEPNIVNGAYSSVEHYLDTQFKLLREDYYMPLREGIESYKKQPDKSLHENIRVYKSVRLLRKHATNNKIGVLVEIPEKKQKMDADIFMFGSLLLFTKDNFQTNLMGTVLDASNELLRDGYIVVLMYTSIPEDGYTGSYLMIESDVFFEPYHQVLKVLQNIKVDEMPFKDYIVDAKPLQKPPAYLKKDTLYKLIEKCSNCEEIPLLDYNAWPTKEQLDLDETQYEAYRLALTREFAVIQGPPGTGKTFIGVQVAKTLLDNVTLLGTPMLVICFTNHALDQFLEHIIKVTSDVVRIGGQSKSNLLESYTLANRRKRTRHYGKAYFDKRKEQEDIMASISNLQEDILKCDRDIISYESVKPFLKVGSKHYKLDSYRDYGDVLCSWLFEHLGNVKNVTSKKYPNDFDRKRIHSSFSKTTALKEIDSLKKNVKYIIDISESEQDRKNMEQKFLNEIRRIEERLSFFEKKIDQHRKDGDCKQIKPVLTADKLTTDDRWSLYFAAVSKVKENLLKELNKLEQSLMCCNNDVDELRMLVDTELVRGSKVVGVTTTAAARVHALLQALNSPIVIVEEAAEVLEAHIVSSLTKSCQHLILIGDHQQLRPTTACYRLAKHYNLEISLFEKMVNNGVHSRRLTKQHRMRPEFVELLVPTIYKQLDSDQSVFNYPDVLGVMKNLFFVSHEVHEDKDIRNSWSHRNIHEAKFAIGFANYLMQHDYKPEDVTILTTYTGQMRLMKEISRSYDRLNGVKITVVDNFQGEESRIVILSLVRSNPEGKIGFLSTSNRICVALSRAKEGFYLIGNIELLASSSKLWKDIKTKLESAQSVGHSIELYCVNHADTRISVRNSEDFNKSPEGGCLQICQEVLKCGHICSLRCHSYDRHHDNIKCSAPCERIIICGNRHKCPKRCGETCDDCTIRVSKCLDCGHEMELPCSVDINHPSVRCNAVVEFKLQCGHVMPKICHIDSKKLKCSSCHSSGKSKAGRKK